MDFGPQVNLKSFLDGKFNIYLNSFKITEIFKEISSNKFQLEKEINFVAVEIIEQLKEISKIL